MKMDKIMVTNEERLAEIELISKQLPKMEEARDELNEKKKNLTKEIQDMKRRLHTLKRGRINDDGSIFVDDRKAKTEIAKAVIYKDLKVSESVREGLHRMYSHSSGDYSASEIDEAILLCEKQLPNEYRVAKELYVKNKKAEGLKNDDIAELLGFQPVTIQGISKGDYFEYLIHYNIRRARKNKEMQEKEQ
jgi:hypothetical protein